MPPQHCLATVRDRLAQSRFFTVSLVLHLILVAFLGGVVLIKKTAPPPDVVATILPEPTPLAPPRSGEPVNKSPSIDNRLANPGTTFDPVIATEQLRSQNPSPSVVDLPSPISPGPVLIGAVGNPSPVFSDQMSPAERKAVGDFTKWREPSRGKDAYSFTAFLGRYQGGNWNSTVRVQNGEITGGSLPNLLYAMSKWSKDKIKTNERNVKAIALDSPELLTARPPFVFLTGTRDFKLTEKEIENLRLYIRSGGAVWGDSSVPGRRSAFDTAFRREMSQVLAGGGDQKFEPLPANHEIFAKGYYKQVKDAPAGVNNYREPVEVLRWSGEIAVIHTINDYGDMWQVGLDKDGRIDTSRDERGQYVALNPALWDYRGTYVRNLEQPAVEQSYRFGINMVLHLLTRWEDRLASPGRL